MTAIPTDPRELPRAAGAASGIDRLSRALVLRLLRGLRHGRLVLEEGGTAYPFGEPGEVEMAAHIHVADPALYRDLLLRGTVGAGEAFMRGAWSSPDLTRVIRVLAANAALLGQLDGRASVLRRLLVAASRLALRCGHALRRNSRAQARLNIAAHYDLGNRFFELFLDPTMMYSAAIFPAADSSLEQASVHKLHRICKKLQLKPRDHLLEIGTGWGGLALHAARHYGCRVTTATISREQYDYACAQVERAGLGERIKVLLCDYRDIEGRYDKLVSVEMIEAVGHQYYRTYFEQCARLLKPDGLMLIQAITIADQRYEAAKRSVDFIQRYIFPGGCLPSIEVIARNAARFTDLNIIGLDDITQHYARTLAAWRERFLARLAEVRALGFDERFISMWLFYLCYCEGGFRERMIGAQQVLLARPGCRIEPVLGAV